MIHPDRENLTWEVFGEASRNLSEQIVASGWFPDLIVGVARGGLIPAGAIGYAIGVKAMGAINVEFYTDIGQTLDEPVILSPQLDTDSLKGKKVLVVDDVADSGKTLIWWLTCSRKPQTMCARPSFTPSRRLSLSRISWKKTDQWINFAWSVLPVITADGSLRKALKSTRMCRRD